MDCIYNFWSGCAVAHTYSLVELDGQRTLNERVYNSRRDAEKAMFKSLGRYGTTLIKVYDDKHDKTYFDNCGHEFIISRQ